MKPLNSRRSAVVGELNLELNLILLDRCTTYRAGVTDPRPGPRAIGASGWQLSSAEYFSGFCTQNFLVGDGKPPGPAGWSCQMPGGPDACSRHPGSPMEGNIKVTLFAWPARVTNRRRHDARLWHPWLRINRVLRVILHTRWSAVQLTLG
jgi:hypothetical protein